MATPGAWATLNLAGKTADVYEPPGPRPRFGALYLHSFDLRTLADSAAFTELLAREQLACVCPHGQQSWWTDRVCRDFDPAVTPERYLLDQVVPFFAERWALRPRSIGLFGIGMGGQGALRLAFKHPEMFPVVAAISPAIEYHELYYQGTAVDEMYDSKEQCRQDTVAMHIHPSRYPPHIFYCIDPGDHPWYRGCDRLHEKLNALGVPHEFDQATRAGGHAWQYFDQMAPRAVSFLQEGLEAESRRLL